MSDTRIPGSFVHLDVRSCFSLKEGAFTPEQLAARAAALGFPAVAMTDRDGLYGAARFVRACEAEGVRPILGASLTVRAITPPGTRWVGKPGRAPRAARDRRHRVREPLPPAHRRAHARRARRSLGRPDADLRARAGLVAIAGPRSHPGRAAVAGRVDHAARLLDPFREAFGRERLFVGVEHRLERGSTDEIRAMLRLAERRRRRRRRDEPRALPRAGRRVRGRRARVHAAHRAARRDERHPAQRRGLAEARRRDARALRRAARPVRRDARRRRHVPVRPGARAHPLPRLPDAGGPQRRRRARRAVLARGARTRHARGPSVCATGCTTSSR